MTKDTSRVADTPGALVSCALVLNNFEESIDKVVTKETTSWLKQTFTATISKQAGNYLLQAAQGIFTHFPRDIRQRYGITRLYPDEIRDKYQGMHGLRWRNGKITYVVTWDGFEIDCSTKLFLKKTINRFKWLQNTDG